MKATSRIFLASLAVSSLVPSIAHAQATFYNNQGTFQSFMTGQGQSMLGFEDFESARTNGFNTLGMTDPLNSSTNNGIFATGSIDQYLTLQSNTGGASDDTLTSRGTNGLVATNTGFGGYPSKNVLANFFADSLDLVFSQGMFGVGGNLVSMFQSSVFRINVWDINNVLIASDSVSVSSTSGFWGVTSTQAIGRINLFSLNNQYEGMDNIEMWGGSSSPVPEPFTMALLGGAALAGYRRVRSRKA